jgi:hypothetical protein
MVENNIVEVYCVHFTPMFGRRNYKLHVNTDVHAFIPINADILNIYLGKL